jgi:hypothetical protein
MDTILLNDMLPCAVLFMLGAQVGLFPGPVVIYAMASAILLYITSLLQDLIRPRLRFSLAQLFFFTAVFAAMLGAAVNIWRML